MKNEKLTISPIAHIHTDFKEKFGIPRQSGLSPSSEGKIVFEAEYKSEEAIRGIEGFSHLWLIFGFSECGECGGRLTVRPPRLGGNERVGVFASRAPFRPNGLGLSSVKLIKAERGNSEGAVLYVAGADLMDGTPIYDIKPYIPYSDCHTDAEGGYADEHRDYILEVEIPREIAIKIENQKLKALEECLARDPRPSYIDDEKRVFSMRFADYDIRFKVREGKLTVIGAETMDSALKSKD